MTSRLGWYARRFSRMSPAEVLWRGRDQALQVIWSGRWVSGQQVDAVVTGQADERRFTAVLPHGTAAQVPENGRKAVLTAADELMKGRWEMLGVVRSDMREPDWFRDPVTGRRAPADRYAFRVNHRSEEDTGNIKQLWELSRLQHLTLLATAWYLTHDDSYARRVAEQLRSWWQENPFLSGVHWTSGIEIGIRLISLTWIRRLLDSWPEVGDLFERNERAVSQIRWHQQYLAAFRSRGSSANNHVIAEAAGQLIASCAFPWFSRSDRWRRTAALLLERELERNTFRSGIGRELASDYQCFVAELGILAAIESAAAGYPLRADVWHRLCAMVDSGAALLDERLRPPRQGDGDDGRALLLDAPAGNRWQSLLAMGEGLFGRLDWWPKAAPSAASAIIVGMSSSRVEVTGRPAQRPWHFDDAGVTLLRTTSSRDPEIWCRCDGGPHGFLKIAAHAHADALSVEIRYGGVEVLADPGTYCYHGEPEWRSYFRSTIAHNTVEIGGQSQSTEGGPFLWRRHANAEVIDVCDIGDAAEWVAEHGGYETLVPPARHRRCVRLDRASRSLDIVDEIVAGGQAIRLAFHLGPDIHAELQGSSVLLRWPGVPTPGSARMDLPEALTWSLMRGKTDPIIGWYSAGLGKKVPAFSLVGWGRPVAAGPMVTRIATRIEFRDYENAGYPTAI